MDNPHWTAGPCFYVSVRDAGRYGLLAGPFKTHEEALAMVDRAKAIALDLDPWAWFYAYGTCQMKDHGLRDGKLNERLGLVIERPACHDATPAQ